MDSIIFQTENSPKKKVGGKASSLLKLHKEGFNVPPFFILSTSLVRRLKNQKARKHIYPEIKRAYKTVIKQGKVSVRSSATIEDLHSSSFAGQFKTVLNVEENDILKAIKVVYSSVPNVVATYGPRIKYGTRIEMAVIIQKMVNPDKAGVLFTADPVIGDRSKIIIEVVKGLGEALVSGAKTPSRYYVSKISEKLLSIKGNRLITTSELKQLCSTAVAIEKLFDYPQDIEFAIKKGTIYILQSRDITTL